MHNVHLGLIASTLSIETGKKNFLSVSDNAYHPIESILPNNDLDIDHNISLLVSEYTSMEKDFSHMSTFLDVIKHGNNIWLYYGIALPSDISLNKCYAVSYNISVINPLVRKAMPYV